MIRMFITILNMSIASSIVILAVLLLRLFLKRAPRIFSYILWIVVFLRLLCPFLPETNWGIIPDFSFIEAGAGTNLWTVGEDRQSAERLRLLYESVANEKVQIKEAGIETGEFSKTSADALMKVKGAWNFAGGIYFAGCIFLLLYGLVSYLLFQKKLRECVSGEKRTSEAKIRTGYGKRCEVVVAEGVRDPFVSGVFRPVIYLPQGLSKKQQELVIAHEMVHIARWDHLIKPAFFIGVCLHWFNPLAWAAFHFMEKDMELSCDEAVLKKTGYENRKAYVDTLLYLSGERIEAGCLIAFGEKSVKTRIKNVVRLKETKSWVMVLLAVGVFAVAALLLVNGKWNFAVSEGEAVAKEAEMIPQENQDVDKESIPGTDSNIETEYIFEDELSEEQILVEEMTYLPVEQIRVEEPIYLPTEQITQVDIPSDEAMVTEHVYYAVEPDKHSVLLRQAEGAYNDTLIEYICPTEYSRVSDVYGERIHPVTQERKMHSGIDFAAEAGTPVKAAASGLVFETGTDAYCGNYVILQHENGDMTYYAHCDEILAETGQGVEQGEQIATVGNTGGSTGSHLHFALSRDGRFVEISF